MFSLFRFDLPNAVTKSLLIELDQLSGSRLDSTNLHLLEEFQARHEIQHGVYLLLQEGIPVYIGKADNVCERLQQHWGKLSGRRNLDINSIAFKALILEVSWSTAANEELLINYFKEKGQCGWNKKGFGPKDPGKERDGYKPGWFDQTYPIDENWIFNRIPDRIPVGDLLEIMKDELPYLLRYEINDNDARNLLDLRGVARSAECLLIHAAKCLGKNWQLMRFKSHFTLYKLEQLKRYSNGDQLHP